MPDRIIGPPRGKRRQRFWMLSSLVAVLALAFAVNSYGGPIGTAAGFEDDDGNLAPQAPINFDWNSFADVSWQPSPTTTPNRTADKVVSGFTFKGIEDWQAANADTAFAGGTKQDDDCATVGTGKAPNKDDLKRIYLASKTGTNGHTYLELAWARIPQNTTSASAHVGFEFNQGDEPCGSGGLVERTAGDMLIVYDFEGGSTDPQITLRRWVTSGACEVGSSSAPCWGPAVNLTATGVAEAEVNVGTTVLDELAPPALNSTTGTSVDQNLNDSEFGEAGIDLTAAGVFPIGSCNSFGTAFGVSRSSGNSAQAAMKDIVGPADFNLTNCGTINIIKRTSPRGVDQNFSFTSTIAGSELECSADTTPAAFTLNDDAGVDNSANTESCVNVPAGSYTVTEGPDPTGFAFTDLSCTATGTGTSATPASGNATKVASITMAGGGSVTCIYTNTQQRGAIEVIKTKKHAASDPSTQPHEGVTFTVKEGAPPDETTVTSGSTNSDGKVCFGNLPFGTYTVSETVPTGYSLDAPGNNRQVVVDNNATCLADGTSAAGEEVTFSNTPLTNITLSVNSQIDGGTASTIDCGQENAPTSTGANGDGSVTRTDLLPGTYTCTVVVDP